MDPSGGERKAVDADQTFECNVWGKLALRFAPRQAVGQRIFGEQRADWRDPGTHSELFVVGQVVLARAVFGLELDSAVVIWCTAVVQMRCIFERELRSREPLEGGLRKASSGGGLESRGGLTRHGTQLMH